MAYKRAFSKKDNSNASNTNETVIELDKKKQITVRKFNNVNLVDIREFYIDKDSNEKKPGKKGISLTEDAWLKLIESSREVQDALDVLNGVESSRKKTKLTENDDNNDDDLVQNETINHQETKGREDGYASDEDDQ